MKLIYEGLWRALFAAIGTVASMPIVARVNIKVFHALLRIMIALSAIMLMARGVLAQTCQAAG